jgi:lipoyl synthase
MSELFDAAPRVVGRGRFPEWLHRGLMPGGGLGVTQGAVRGQKLHTVCEEARCPNLMECWSHKTATFMAMGKECTRNCGFCDVGFTKEAPPLEADEPERIVKSIGELGLRHAVVTMVARDDLEDGGAAHLVAIVEAIRRGCPGVTVELLISDLQGNREALEQVLATEPEILNHNIETVRRLTPRVRHRATYERTLELLGRSRKWRGGAPVKSGLMVGLGESVEEVQETLRDLKEAGVDVVTMGQYLQPHKHKLRVKEFVHPDQFEAYAEYGRSIGIPHLFVGPFMRSSYNAGALLKQIHGHTQHTAAPTTSAC